MSEGATRIAESRLTSQGQVSVPAEVRRRLGIGPGSVIEWDDDGERITVRRAARVTSAQVHEAIFRYAPRPRPLAALKAGVRERMKRKHARR